MSKTLKKINVRFDEWNMVVEESFPQDLEGYVDEADYEAVIRKINVELNTEIVETRHDMLRWSTIFASTAVFLIGLVFTPVVAVKARRYREALGHFWDDVKAHLSIVNRRAHSKRAQQWVEWHIRQSGHNKRGTDVFDPYTVFQLVVVVKVRPLKAEGGYQAKQFNRATDFNGEAGGEADTSYTGGDERPSVPAALLQGDRRVSFVTPFDSSTTTTTAQTDGTIEEGSIVMPDESREASSSGLALGGAAIAAAVVAVGVIKEEPEGEDGIFYGSDVEGADHFDTYGSIGPGIIGSSAVAGVMAIQQPASATDKRVSIAPLVVASTRPMSTTSMAPLAEDDDEDSAGSHRMSTSSVMPISATSGSNRASTSSMLSIAPVFIAAKSDEIDDESGPVEEGSAQNHRMSTLSIAPVQIDAASTALATVPEDDEDSIRVPCVISGVNGDESKQTSPRPISSTSTSSGMSLDNIAAITAAAALGGGSLVRSEEESATQPDISEDDSIEAIGMGQDGPAIPIREPSMLSEIPASSDESIQGVTSVIMPADMQRMGTDSLDSLEVIQLPALSSEEVSAADEDTPEFMRTVKKSTFSDSDSGSII